MRVNCIYRFLGTSLLFTFILFAPDVLSQDEIAKKKIKRIESDFFDAIDHGPTFTMAFENRSCFGIGYFIVGSIDNSTRYRWLNVHEFAASVHFDGKYGFNNPFFSPRVSLTSVHFAFIMLNVDFTYNFNAFENDFRIVPHIGFTFGGFASICYGYNFVASKHKIDVLGRNRLMFNFSLPLTFILGE